MVLLRLGLMVHLNLRQEVLLLLGHLDQLRIGLEFLPLLGLLVHLRLGLEVRLHLGLSVHLHLGLLYGLCSSIDLWCTWNLLSTAATCTVVTYAAFTPPMCCSMIKFIAVFTAALAG